MQQRPPYISVLLVSACALAYEILLMRLFSIIQWHHFAYMIIALALLGYGISGAMVVIFQQRLLRYFNTFYIGAIALFALSAVLCFARSQQIPFNAEEILWDAQQVVYLGAVFLLLAIPFLFAATAICLAFMQFSAQVSRLYAMDLLGAGMGSLGCIGLLYWLFPQQALMLTAYLAVIAAAVALLELAVRPWRRPDLAVLLVIVVLLVHHQTLALQLSPYKGLSQLLQINGTQVIDQKTSPLGLLQVVRSSQVPLRHAPGLSLTANQEPLPQLAVFTDADNMTVLTQYPGKHEQLAYLDQMTSALAYHLRSIDRLLVIGAGGGSDVLQARYHGTAQIDAVELNPQIIQLVNDDFGEFTGHLYQRPGIHVHQAEARDFLSHSSQHYDLIQLALVDTFNASSSGLYALNESYLYTVEGLQTYLAHLGQDGYLALTRWIKLPPRDSLKLFNSLITTMRHIGILDPGQHLLMIRSWQTSTILVKNGAYSAKDIAATEAFCRQRGFDLAYAPGMAASQANRYNQLPSPEFYQATMALLGKQRAQFMAQYKFNLQPATDNRPYFHQFFKWSSLPEIVQLRGQGGMPLIEWGYITLIATLCIAMAFSAVLILLPVLILLWRASGSRVSIKRGQVLVYFFAIGLAFLFIEIALMQKFILFLHHPVLAMAVTLTAFLLFSGVGSDWSGRLLVTRRRREVLQFAIFGIIGINSIYLFLLPNLFSGLAGLPVSLKIVTSVLLIAPLALCMGMPFPLALGSLAKHAQLYLPWAWAINGCASVISAVLATILAIHFGFMLVIMLAMVFYAGTVLVFPEPDTDQ